jgi:lipopolysaccharide export system permease protein
MTPAPAAGRAWWCQAFLVRRLRILDRYVATRIAWTYLLVLLALLTIFNLLALIDELEDLGKGHYRLADIALFVAMTSPRRAVDLVPIVALLGSVIALGALAGTGELGAMQVAGVSTPRIAWAALKPVLLFTVGAVAAGELLVPPLEQAAHVLRTRAISTITAIRADQSVWARGGLRFLHVRRVGESDVLDGVEIFEFDADQGLRLFLRAERADIGAGQLWRLTNVLEKEIGPSGITTRQLPSRSWESFMSREQIGLLALPSASLSSTDLYRYVNLLRAGGQNAARYEMALWRKISMPLAASAMVLLAIPFVFGLLRVASTGQRVMVGTTLAIAFHLGDQILARVGLIMNLNPAMISLAPVGAVLATAAWLFRRPF